MARAGRVFALHDAVIDRVAPRRLESLRVNSSEAGIEIEIALELIGSRYIRHRVLVLQPFFRQLVGDRGAENGAPRLQRNHPAGAEASPVTDRIDLVEYRSRRVSGAQKIGVQRMHPATAFHGARGRVHRLRQHLPAVDTFLASGRRGAAKPIGIEVLDGKYIQQCVQIIAHCVFPFPVLVAGHFMRWIMVSPDNLVITLRPFRIPVQQEDVTA